MSMHLPVILAMWGGMELPIIIGAAILLFGGSKIRDLARGLGAAKREFKIGEAEADLAEERLRAQARAQAEAGSVPPPQTYSQAEPNGVVPAQHPPGPPPPLTPPMASPPTQ